MEPCALRFKNSSNYVGIALCFLITEDLPNLDRWKSWVEESKGLCRPWFHCSDDKAHQVTQPWVLDHAVSSPLEETKHGDVSLVRAESRLYKAVLDYNYELLTSGESHVIYHMIIFVSGQHIPVTSFRVVYDHLLRDRHGKSYMEVLPAPSYKRPSSSSRKHRRLFRQFGYSALKRGEVPVAKQFKMLNIKDAVEFVKMTQDEKYMDMWSDPSSRTASSSAAGLAPDELAFPFWMYRTLNQSWKDMHLRFLNKGKFLFWEDMGANGRAKAFDRITPAIQTQIEQDGALFARKFTRLHS